MNVNKNTSWKSPDELRYRDTSRNHPRFNQVMPNTLTPKVRQEIGALNREEMFPQLQNGRVIDIAEKPVEWFQLFTDNVPNRSFQGQALYGIQNCSPLSKAYFSKENVEILQNQIRYNVWLKSDKKYIIGEQSTVELEIIMRSIYLQFSRNLPYKVKDQVKELNNILVHQVTGRIISNLYQYLGYLHRVETLPTPIELPRSTNSSGTKLLKSVTSTF